MRRVLALRPRRPHTHVHPRSTCRAALPPSPRSIRALGCGEGNQPQSAPLLCRRRPAGRPSVVRHHQLNSRLPWHVQTSSWRACCAPVACGSCRTCCCLPPTMPCPLLLHRQTYKDARIDLLRVWPHALDDDGIAALYQLQQHCERASPLHATVCNVPSEDTPPKDARAASPLKACARVASPRPLHASPFLHFEPLSCFLSRRFGSPRLPRERPG